jgi:hypothetical protein
MNNLSWAETVRQVHARARFQCEYCQTSQRVIGQAMHVEHIDPHAGDDLANLCLSCPSCNLSKASATSAVDPETQTRVTLFNPRQQIWAEHFTWMQNSTVIEGKSAVGRATVERFKMNVVRLVEARKIWVQSGAHPPDNEE